MSQGHVPSLSLPLLFAMTCITLTSLLQNDLHLYHTQTSLSRGSPSDFFPMSLIIHFIRTLQLCCSLIPKSQGLAGASRTLTKFFLHFLSPCAVVKAYPPTSKLLLLPASSSACLGQRHSALVKRAHSAGENYIST